MLSIYIDQVHKYMCVVEDMYTKMWDQPVVSWSCIPNMPQHLFASLALPPS